MTDRLQEARVKALRRKFRGEMVALAIIIIAAGVPLICIAGVAYIAIHFVIKFW